MLLAALGSACQLFQNTENEAVPWQGSGGFFGLSMYVSGTVILPITLMMESKEACARDSWQCQAGWSRVPLWKLPLRSWAKWHGKVQRVGGGNLLG